MAESDMKTVFFWKKMLVSMHYWDLTVHMAKNRWIFIQAVANHTAFGQLSPKKDKERKRPSAIIKAELKIQAACEYLQS